MFVSEVRRFERHIDKVTGVLFSAGSRRVLSFSKASRLWDITTGKEIRQFRGYKRGVMSAAFSPDGRQLISMDMDGLVRIHDVDTGKEIHNFRAYSSHGNRLVLSPEGEFIVTSGGDYRTHRKIDVECKVKLWKRATGEEMRRFNGHTSFVNCLALSHDGKYLLTGAGHLDGDQRPIDCSVRLWDVSTGKEIRHFDGHVDTVGSVAFSPDGRHALSGSWDHTIRLWDISTSKAEQTFSGHTEAVWSVAYSPDGKYVLSGSGTAREIKGHMRMLKLSTDCTLRIWEANTGKELISLGHPEPVYAVAFSPNGQSIASGCGDGIVRLYHLILKEE